MWSGVAWEAFGYTAISLESRMPMPSRLSLQYRGLKSSMTRLVMGMVYTPPNAATTLLEAPKYSRKSLDSEKCLLQYVLNKSGVIVHS